MHTGIIRGINCTKTAVGSIFCIDSSQKRIDRVEADNINHVR